MTSLVAFSAIGGTGIAGGPGSGKSQYAPGYANGQKITVCHKGKTIRVALISWKGHEKHGDTKGACVSTSASTSTSKGQSNGKAKGKNK